MTADAWGIEAEYEDAQGTLRRTTDETRAGILRAMGVTADAPPPDAAGVQVVQAGTPIALHGPGELTLEDGTRLSIERELPRDLPIGYHDFLQRRSQTPTRLIVSPGHCILPDDLRTWGWAAQLYAVRSDRSWGIGDLADLRALARWSADLGAGIVMVNPLHAAAPVLPQEPSPYFPSSRRFRNPLYLRLDEVPGFEEAELELRQNVRSGRALNLDRLIDRDAVFRLKNAALERLWSTFGGDRQFDDYCRQQGQALHEYACYCVLAEKFGKNWRQWESQYRRPDLDAVGNIAKELADRIAFHKWLQWLLDRQLAAATAELPVMQDLPIGSDPDGADAWTWQDVLAHGARIGAPPDIFNTQGQDWGLPPFVPHKLRAARYGPFIEVIRATLRHARGLRIDHALGLFRLYWIPEGAHPKAGAYVRYPADELMAIVAIESQRAGAIVVGEDLGTVEAGVRKALADHNILSYRVLWFEKCPPKEYPEKALAAVTTHDLPTVAGLWSGADLQCQRELGLQPNEESMAAMKQHLQAVAGLSPYSSVDQAIEGAYRALSSAPSAILTATLEDVLAVDQRPNMPSTTTRERPNWSLALPGGLRALQQSEMAQEIARLLARQEIHRSTDEPVGIDRS